MQQDKPRVLIISSCPLSMGPAAIAGQYYDALLRKGIETDLLLKLPEPGRPDIKYVWEEDKKPSFFQRIMRKVKRRLSKYAVSKPGFCFFYKKENNPPVPSQDILNKITKPYDLVYVVFWQTMLSFESIDKIFNKLHCQIHFCGVDYSQMSGGCHFTGDCQRYKIGCGCCPAFNSNNQNDFTAWNVQYRKKVYEKVKPIVYGNQYMMNFYKESYLLKDARCELNPSAIIDTDVFKPLNIDPIRLKYGISEEKKYIVFFACHFLDDTRKGIYYLIDALNILYDNLSGKINEILIIMAGREYEKVNNLIPFESMGMGYVPMNILPELFSISTLFVCPSINDAGPMMVGQSLCCGTPVVGFDMGSVKQLVKNQGTGVCVSLKDSKALAEGIRSIILMPKDKYKIMATRCREIALRFCSYDAQADLILNTYYRYKNYTD